MQTAPGFPAGTIPSATYVEAEEVLGGGVEQRDLPAGLLLDVGAAQAVTGTARTRHQQRPASHRPPLQQEEGHEGHDTCAGREVSVTVGTDPLVVHGHRAAAGGLGRSRCGASPRDVPSTGHPRGGRPAGAGTHPAREGFQLSPQTFPATTTCPSRSRPPHLPPGRRSPASLPGGAPRGIPTFRNEPGDDLSGLIKYAKRFSPPLSPAGRCGSEAPPRPRLTQRGRPQGNLPSASPPFSLPPPAPPPASVSLSAKWAQRRGAPGRDAAAAGDTGQEIPGHGTRGPLSRWQLGRPGVPPPAGGVRVGCSNPPPPSLGMPPQSSIPARGGRSACGTLPLRPASSGQGTLGGSLGDPHRRVTWLPPAVSRQGGGPVRCRGEVCCQAKSPGRDERRSCPHLSAPPTCRRCRVIQNLLYLPCPGGKGLTWACCDP